MTLWDVQDNKQHQKKLSHKNLLMYDIVLVSNYKLGACTVKGGCMSQTATQIITL